MTVYKPEEWPSAFEKSLNEGDLEQVLALYDSEAAFVSAPGEIIVGREKIRPIIAGLIKKEARFASRVMSVTAVGDIAVLYTDFEGTISDGSQRRMPIQSKAIEV